MIVNHYLKLIIFIFTLWGYPFVASWVVNPEYSQLITVPYRAVVTLGALIFVFISVKNFKIIKKNFLFYSLIFFIISYSFRILNETLDPTVSLSKPPSVFLLSWFLISILPSLIFVLTDYTPENGKLYLYYDFVTIWIILYIVAYFFF